MLTNFLFLTVVSKKTNDLWRKKNRKERKEGKGFGSRTIVNRPFQSSNRLKVFLMGMLAWPVTGRKLHFWQRANAKTSRYIFFLYIIYDCRLEKNRFYISTLLSWYIIWSRLENLSTSTVTEIHSKKEWEQAVL